MSRGYEDEYDDRDRDDEGAREPIPEQPSAGSNNLLAPGILMIITGVLNLVCAFGGIMMGVTFANMPDAELQKAFEQQDAAKRKQMEDAGIGVNELRKIYVYGGGGGGALWLVCSLITIIGGICMCARKARGLAIFAALVTVVPCVTSPCCFLGLPVGIWSLVALMRRGA